MLARFSSSATLFLALTSVSACGGKTGAVCRCNTDCREGLVCQGETRALNCNSPDHDNNSVGECVADPEQPGEGEQTDLEEPPPYLDLPSKRDLGFGEGDDGGEETGTTSTGEDEGSDTNESSGESSETGSDTDTDGGESGGESGDESGTESSTGS